MISLQNAGKRYGPRVLFLEANWLIRSKEKTALVGANGTGKSTILKVLAGIETLDYGEMQQTRGMSIGYLPQEGLALTGRTVFEECLSVFDELREMAREVERLSGQLAVLEHAGLEYEAAAERYSMLQERFHALDGYALDAQVGGVLTGLGFGKEDWTRQTDEFSGGWQMRIALAKLLLAKPNLLLLDEPTNHLDLETRNWLEDYLRNYPFGYILISHDRYFLDVTIDRTVEIWNKRVTIYQGNYTKYLSQKNERRSQLQAAYNNQRQKIEHLEAFINRFRYQATKAKQVQSRIKELEKIERIEIPEAESTIHFRFPQPQPSGRMVAEAEGLAKSYGPKQVFKDVRFRIDRGDRVALVGVNGAGKSTLIRLLTGAEPPTAGHIKLGHNVVCEYFAQDQYKVLDGDARMIDDISRAAVKVPEGELRSLLGCFLFSGDDVFKPLGVLSGGERNRFALARILVSPSNFLLLDEPTNHLDMRAKDVLLEALAAFSGTVVFVSHDRYFIDRLATRVLEVEGGKVTSHEGNYEDYLRWKTAQTASPPDCHPERAERVEGPASQPQTVAPLSNGANHSNGAAVDRPRRLNPIKQKQMEERCAFLEEEVPRIEAAIAHTEEQLSVYVSAAETQRLTALAEELRGQLAALTAEWEELMGQLDGQGAPS
ncbi:MAG: ABC-F family ATP-binding cassette domain-containing protein [Terracidiphilus sp.]|jgi:ATP-binding cassette subfamily F protein 3